MIAHVRFRHTALHGTVQLPSSKSISNRLLLLNALTGNRAPIDKLSDARDTRLLQQLLASDTDFLDAGDAGTVYRFLTAYLAFVEGRWTLSGSPRMLARPIGALVDSLRTLGARIDYAGQEGFPPLTITGGLLRGGEVEVDGTVSSQFISALLLIAPFLSEGLTLQLRGTPVSAPYIRMTLALLARCGGVVAQEGDRIRVEPVRLHMHRLSVEADWSSAAFFVQAAALANQAEIRVPGLGEDSVQGDARLAELAPMFGVEMSFDPDGCSIRKSGQVRNDLALDLRGEPDLFPALCATVAGAGVAARFTGLEHLRIKESDRLLAMEENLLLLGADCSLEDGGFVLRSARTLRDDGILLNGFADHRIVMSLALLAIRCGFIRVTDAEEVAKSFPGFWDALQSLGFEVHLAP